MKYFLEKQFLRFVVFYKYIRFVTIMIVSELDKKRVLRDIYILLISEIVFFSNNLDRYLF